MQQYTLNAQQRSTRGKEAAKKMRRAGQVPAILYGRGLEPLALAVNTKEVHKALHTGAGENVIVNLKVPSNGSEQSFTAMIHEVQRDAFQMNYFHIDFQQISLTEKVTATVKILVHGHAAGEKNGGNTDQVLWEVEVETLPLSIPEHFDLDVSPLEIGDSLHVRDLTVPEGVEILADLDDVIVIVHAPRVEEVVEPVVAEAATPAEPEVIAKGKTTEE